MQSGPEDEARRLLAIHDGDMAACNQVLTQQFGVLQTRSQLLLTLATITLTITGFSGPRMAQLGAYTRWSLAMGLLFVLLSLLLILLGTLRIRWVTQYLVRDDPDSLAEVIRHRDRKTALYLSQLALLVIGLVLYVTAVVVFLLLGTAELAV